MWTAGISQEARGARSPGAPTITQAGTPNLFVQAAKRTYYFPDGKTSTPRDGKGTWVHGTPADLGRELFDCSTSPKMGKPGGALREG